MDEKLLESLGLNSKEISLYRAILRMGEATPAHLAKAIGIKRTTAYSMARGLVERGLLIEDATRRPRVFAPATPKEVLGLIGEEKKRLELKEQTLKDLAVALEKNSAKKQYPVPTVRFIEEAKIRDFLFNQDSVWDKSVSDVAEGTWWGFQDHTFVEHYGDWITEYWRWAPKTLEVKLLSNRAPVELEFAEQGIERRFIKFWGEATSFRSSTWICGDYIIMVNTRQKPFYLVEIHDALMAHDQREVFRNLWPLI